MSLYLDDLRPKLQNRVLHTLSIEEAPLVVGSLRCRMFLRLGMGSFSTVNSSTSSKPSSSRNLSVENLPAEIQPLLLRARGYDTESSPNRDSRLGN